MSRIDTDPICSQAFAEKLRHGVAAILQGQKPPRSRAYKHSKQARAHSMEEAERYVRDGLAAAGLGTAELPGLKGSDLRKVVLARLLWRRTTATQKWIAKKLHMRSAANVSQQVRRLEKAGVKKAGCPAELKAFIKSHEHP